MTRAWNGGHAPRMPTDAIELRLEGLDDALHPGPGLDVPAEVPKLPAAGKAWKDVEAELQKRAGFWPDGIAGPDEVVTHVRTIKAWVGGPKPDPIDPGREGVLVAMIGQARARWESTPHPGPKVLRYHLVRGGFPLAIEAQVRAAGLRYSIVESTGSYGRVVRVHKATMEPGAPELVGFDSIWSSLKELRARLSLATHEELAACDSMVDRLASEPLGPTARAALAYLCPHRPELALAALDVPLPYVPLVLQSLADAEQAVRLAEEGWHRFLGGATVKLVGPPLAGALLSRVRDGGPQWLPRLLSRFGSPEVADVLIEGLALDRFEVASVEPFLLAFPALSLPRLEARSMMDVRARVLAARPELDPNAGPVAAQDALPPALRGTSTRSMPTFWQPSTWTTLTTKEGATLSLPALHRLGEALMDASGASTPAVREIFDALDQAKLADFLFDMVQAWAADYRGRAAKWVLPSLALLDDAHADRVGTLVRKWTGNAYANAVAGVRVLVAMGGDRALLQLGHIAEKHKTRGVKSAAASQLSAIARARRLSRDELDDRLVPTLGLDANGSMTLDYGPRRFEVRFDEQLSPIVRDEKGKVRSAPPTPAASDDPARSKAAFESFKQLKKDVRTLASTQVARLESALVTGRRWPNASAARFVYRHPLLCHLGRRLLWSTEGDRFRVDEEGATIDLEERPISITPDTQVWLTHPVDLDDAESARWGEVFADYQLISPFAQLGRPVYRLGDVAAEQALESVRRAKLPPGKVRSLLHHGWQRGGVEDGGQYYSLTRSLGGSKVELTMKNGLNVNAWSGEPDVEMSDVRFTAQGTPVSFSEIVRELSGLLA